MDCPLLKLAALPLIATLLCVSGIKPAFIRSINALMLWAQLALVTFVLSPLLFGKQETMAIGIGVLTGFSVDKFGALFALLSNLVVAASVSHASFVYFPNEIRRDAGADDQSRLFYLCSNLFLLAMISVCISDNLGYLWISIEATTLASAPLVYYARTKHALEATWKYLIICSVGIAFALFGTILIYAASQHGLGQGTLEISQLMGSAKSLDYSLLRLGFIFCLLGYGTKAGIFPLHSWLPDAHSEAPAPASAMLSGGLLNCALLAIWRLSAIVLASGHSNLALKMPLVLGITTVLAASFFLVRQHGLKRIWAYSSVENVGLMLSAIGLGSAPLFFLLALNHSLAKVSIFLLSGNIIQATGKYEIHDIKGILELSPSGAILLALSTFAVTGAPPFGAFIAEWALLAQSAEQSMWWVVGILVFALALTFVVVCYHLSRCLWGIPSQSYKNLNQFSANFVPAILLATTLVVGTTKFSQYILRLP